MQKVGKGDPEAFLNPCTKCVITDDARFQRRWSLWPRTAAYRELTYLKDQVKVTGSTCLIPSKYTRVANELLTWLRMLISHSDDKLQKISHQSVK